MIVIIMIIVIIVIMVIIVRIVIMVMMFLTTPNVALTPREKNISEVSSGVVSLKGCR